MMNIVLIFADQMHKYALGKVSGDVYTPNLDRLCEEGVLFTNAYSNCPVCGPFRGNLFTGQYASASGVVKNGDALPEGILTMADAFNHSGYSTSFVGKWHLGGQGNGIVPKELRGGFERFSGYQCYNGFYGGVRFYDENNTEQEYIGHRTEATTKIAVERLGELKEARRPFLHVVAYQAPHYPVQPLKKFEKLYRDKVFSMGPDYRETAPYTPTFSPPSPRPYTECPDYRRYGGDMQEYLRLYYGMVSGVDEGVGKIVRELKKLGLFEETAIFFTSDHGDMQGSHGLKNKCSPYEKSCGIPLIASVPGGEKNVRSEILLSGIDLYPTFLEYAGISFPAQLQGKSFVRSSSEGEGCSGAAVFAEVLNYGKPWRMARRGDFKLVVDLKNGEPELLFDLRRDPFELENLLDFPVHYGVINEMAELIEREFAFSGRRPACGT